MATTGERATGTITIEYNTVTVTPGADGDVWLTTSEIARMFEVFVPAITSNIRAIYKHGALRMSETSNLPTAHAELYNLEMISALAFRVDTPQSAAFRRWLIRRPDGRAEGLAGGTDGSELTSERKNPSNHLDSNVFAPVEIHPDRGDFQFREFVRQTVFSFRCYSNALSSVPLYESRSNFSISDSRYSTFPHIM